MITWLSANFRAWVIRDFLKANDKELGEHWLGISRDDLSESLLKIVATMEHKLASSSVTLKSMAEDWAVRQVSEKAVPIPSPIVPELDSELITLWEARIKKKEVLAESCTLVVVKPIRQCLRNWSGCEDVMSVALEMTKHACRSRAFGNPG